MERKNIASGTKWEPKVGYSRAVRVGNMIFVSGTTATDESGAIAAKGNPYGQAVQIIRTIQKALADCGATLEDVVRTRIYVTNIDHWELIGKAHGAYFGHIRPATSLVEVRRLIDPDVLVEIEADAVVSGSH